MPKPPTTVSKTMGFFGKLFIYITIVFALPLFLLVDSYQERKPKPEPSPDHFDWMWFPILLGFVWWWVAKTNRTRRQQNEATKQRTEDARRLSADFPPTINLNEDERIRKFAKHFHRTELEVRIAIKKVGPAVENVMRELEA